MGTKYFVHTIIASQITACNEQLIHNHLSSKLQKPSNFRFLN